MLLLGFYIDKDMYGLDTKDIIDVIPHVMLKTIPGSPLGVVGILNYHGDSVPVIDVQLLAGQDRSVNSLTTRIALVKYKSNILGLVISGVTETLRINRDQFHIAKIKINNNDFLGDIAKHNNTFVQLIDVDRLLTEPVFECLFPSPQGEGV